MKTIFYALTLLCLTPAMLLAHGVVHSMVDGAVAVKGGYANGTPLAHAEAEVWAPDATEPHQRGEADRHGVFAFVPDRDGPWRVTLDDGMGHRIETVVDIGADALVPGMAERPANGRWGAGVVGVSLIFGAFGLWSLFFRRESAASCT